MKELTAKEEKFAEYYIQTFNATKAIKEAGYEVSSDAIASVMGYEYLRKPHILEYIKKRTALESVKIKLETDDILQELTKIALGETKDIIIRKKKEKVIYQEIRSLTKDRLRALELLGRIYGLFNDNIQVGFKQEDLVFNIYSVTKEEAINIQNKKD